MQTETVARLREADELEIQTLCPAEPWSVGQDGQDTRGGVLNGWKLYLPQAADVIPSDRMRVRGREFAVLGEPADWAGAGVVVTVGDVWTAECTIRRPGGVRGAFNTATGSYPTVPHDPHYTGLCRVDVLTVGSGTVEAAGEQLTTLGYLVVVDLTASTEVQVGDLVTITANLANGDPLLVGRSVQVESFYRGAMPWQRNLVCTDFLAPESLE